MVTCAHQYGLEEDDLQQIRRILGLFPHIEEVTLFGSRAKGNYKRGSDIDLCIKGREFNRNDLSTLFVIFEASLLPYFVDIVCYYKLKDGPLKEHIDQYGIPIYKRGT